MLKRFTWVLVSVLLLAIAGSAQAQEPPAALNDALADLSARAGTTVALDDLSNWRWTQQNYPDTSLGCPQSGQTYAQVVTNGYQFLLTYNGITYDYRVSADRQTLILCTNPAPQATATPAPDAATPLPTVEPGAATSTPASATLDYTGRLVCADAMPTRLAAGIQARAVPDGVPSNIRREPSSSSDILGQVPAGGEFTILEGPGCAENMVWWHIDYDTLTGWIAEGQNGTYRLEPLAPVPTPTPRPGITPAAQPTSPPSPQPYDLPPDRQVIAPANAGQIVAFQDLPVGQTVSALDWSTVGSALAAASEQATWVYSTAAFSLTPRVLQAPGPVHDVVFSPTNNVMATAYNDTTVRLWDVTTGGQRAVLQGHTSPVLTLAFSPDGSLLASGSGDEATNTDSVIRLWDVGTNQTTAVLEGHTAPIRALAFSPDGTLLASAGLDGIVRLWDVVSATLARELAGHDGPVLAAAFNPAGTRLATAGEDGIIRLWDLETGEALEYEGHESPVDALAFSPDGSLLASAGGALPDPGDNTVHLWDVAAGELAATLDDYGADDTALVTDLVFSPDGTALAFVSVQDGTSTVRLWGVEPAG
jgi:hypothetical protein